MTKVGMIGLGIMGAPMALNLLRGGHELTVWNRDPRKCEPLAAKGATVASTPREVAQACDITFAMVSDPEAARAVALSEDGVVAGLGPGKGYVDVSTIDPESAVVIGEAVKATGATYLEAPVSGSKKPAEDGALIFLCGGDEELYRRAMPMLDEMGKLSVYLGKIGNGAKMKLVVNMIMGTMLTSLCEGMSLADRSGLDLATLLQVLDSGAVANPMFALKGPNLQRDEYPTAFPLKHMQKDMRLALALGEATGQPLPVAAAANEDFIKALADNLADADFSAVYRAVK